MRRVVEKKNGLLTELELTRRRKCKNGRGRKKSAKPKRWKMVEEKT
jgi:hypothetical protein